MFYSVHTHPQPHRRVSSPISELFSRGQYISAAFRRYQYYANVVSLWYVCHYQANHLIKYIVFIIVAFNLSLIMFLAVAYLLLVCCCSHSFCAPLFSLLLPARRFLFRSISISKNNLHGKKATVWLMWYTYNKRLKHPCEWPVVNGIYAGSCVHMHEHSAHVSVVNLCCNMNDKKHNSKNKHAINIMHFN